MTPRSLLRRRIVLAAALVTFAWALQAQEPQKAGAPVAPAATGARAAPALRAEPVPPAVDTAFRAWDTNHDDALSLVEFRNGWRNMKRGSRQTTGAGLRQQFERLDANDNDGIDRVEYSDMVLLKRAGTLAPPFSEADRNRSQKLEFDEYSALVQRLRSNRVPPRTPGTRPQPGPDTR